MGFDTLSYLFGFSAGVVVLYDMGGGYMDDLVDDLVFMIAYFVGCVYCRRSYLYKCGGKN
mgnify:CR=1 FL=1